MMFYLVWKDYSGWLRLLCKWHIIWIDILLTFAKFLTSKNITGYWVKLVGALKINGSTSTPQQVDTFEIMPYEDRRVPSDYLQIVLSTLKIKSVGPTKISCPNTVIYIPNFITPSEEQNILTSVYNAPKPKWDQLTHRRLLNYGGVPHKNGMIAEVMPNWLQNYVDKINNLGIFDTKKANHVLVNEYLPKQGIMPHLDGPLFYPTITTISCGSHAVLEFLESNDNNPEFAETLKSSIAGPSQHNKTFDDPIGTNDSHQSSRKVICKLLIERRSLLILKDDMYHKYLHAISEIDEDVISEHVVNLQHCSHTYKLGDRIKRETRLSLTIRHVPKTSKMKLKLGN